MKKLTLQLRLILSFLLISAAVWSGAAVLSWYESREQMDEFFDTYQLLLGRRLAAADWSHFTPELQTQTNRLLDDVDEDGEEEDEALGFAVFTPQGEMIFNDDENGRDFIFTPGASGFLNQPLGRKGKPWRIFWLPTADKKYVIAVGQELAYRNEAALELVEETLMPWLVGLSLLMLGIIWLVSREFRPLRTIAANLSARTSGSLEPLPLTGQPAEIHPLIKAINAQFARIAEMLRRERGFIADSAHELRTPLTALKVQLEVARLAENDSAGRDEALNKLEQGIERSARLVEQLLALSRLDAADRPDDEPLDWNAIISAALNEHRDAAAAKGISLTVSSDDTAPLSSGQPLLWSLLLRNLLDNAVRYSPAGAAVTVTRQQGALVVSNTGISVTSEYLPRLHERFFRPPGQTAAGSGLGLSIVERIAALHNCTLSIDNRDQIFRVIIRAHPAKQR